MNFFEIVYEVVGTIPYGHVMSYGQVARLAGNPRMARQVGWALHALKSEKSVPWQRVVRKDGSIADRFALDAGEIQAQLLLDEVIQFDEKGRVLQEFFISDEDLFRL